MGSTDDVRVLVPRRQIAQRVFQLAVDINACYAGCELTVVGVLTGSVIFLADLVRELSMPIRLDVVNVCSYPGTATRSEGPQLTMPPAGDLAGRHILIVDDILDSGRTFDFLMEFCQDMKPASVRTCVFLRKDRPDVPERDEVDFVGFDIPDMFVVGYGLDFDDLYRNLPDLCVLTEHDTGQEVRV